VATLNGEHFSFSRMSFSDVGERLITTFCVDSCIRLKLSEGEVLSLRSHPHFSGNVREGFESALRMGGNARGAFTGHIRFMYDPKTRTFTTHR
jgi:hypothetical protein